MVLLDDFAHLVLQRLQHFRSKGDGRVKVVIEPVVNGGADGELGLGIEALYRLGEHVRRGVPECKAAALVVKGQKLQAAVLFYNGGQVAHRPVDLGRKRGPGKALRYVGRDRARADRLGILAHSAVF